MNRLLMAAVLLTLSLGVAHADDCAPAKVSGLTVTMGKSSAILQFNDSGNDCATGTAASYEVRYSTSAITESNYYNASVAGTGTPAGAAGTPDCFTVNAGTLTCNSHTYFFAITFTDAAGNRSPVSNSPSGTTHSCTSAEVSCP